MEEPAPLIKHSRKTNARARVLQVVFATEETIIGGGKKGYARMESLTQKHSVAIQGPLGFGRDTQGAMVRLKGSCTQSLP